MAKTVQRKKKATKKKKPKVKLDSRSVLVLAAVIVFLCACLLSVSLFFSDAAPVVSEPEVPEPAKEKIVALDPPSKTKKSESSVKKQEEKRVQPKNDAKKTVQEKPAPKAEVKKQPETVTKTAQKPAENIKSEPSKKIDSTESTKQKSEKSSAPEVKKSESKPSEVKVPAEKKQIASASVPPAKKETSVSKYNIPQAVNNPIITFIIDDAGLSAANVKKYTSLPFPITIAVLPKLSQTKECAAVIRSSGKTMILHQPMQAINLKMNPGPGAVRQEMSLQEVRQTVKDNLMELGSGVKGLNNHEGSLITSDEMKIGAVLDVVQDMGLYFIDSRTTKDTMAPQAALERDMKIYERDIFIDNIISREEMLNQIYRGLGIANKKGKVIMIAHVDKSVNILPDLLRDMHPYLIKAGYRIENVR